MQLQKLYNLQIKFLSNCILYAFKREMKLLSVIFPLFEKYLFLENNNNQRNNDC